MIEIEHEWLNQTDGPVEIIIYVYSKRRKKDMMKALHKLDLGSIEKEMLTDGLKVFELTFEVRVAAPYNTDAEEIFDAALVDRCIHMDSLMGEIIERTSRRVYMDQSLSKIQDRVKGLIRDHLQAKINAGRKPWEVQDGKAM